MRASKTDLVMFLLSTGITLLWILLPTSLPPFLVGAAWFAVLVCAVSDRL